MTTNEVLNSCFHLFGALQSSIGGGQTREMLRIQATRLPLRAVYLGAVEK